MLDKTYQTVKIEKEDGICWVTLNRPEKKNAMSPTMHLEMQEVLEGVQIDDDVRVMVLTGAGDSWCAGQDLKEFFMEVNKDPAMKVKAYRAAHDWRWPQLAMLPKPTIAMVNGFCFGGGFTQLVACDFAIAADDAVFGLSEVNWGILPGGIVTKAVLEAMSLRDTMWYCMLGDTFDGKTAAEMRLVNKSVPADRLREETVALAKRLMGKNPATLAAIKTAVRSVRTMDVSQAQDYLMAKVAEIQMADPERGPREGLRQFVEEKSYRPGLGGYDIER